MAVDLVALLADPSSVPRDQIPAVIGELEKLKAALWARLAGDHQVDDCDCLDAEDVSRLLKCSVDLIRQRGEEWGIAKVLARDSRGRPSRIVYPKALLRVYLSAREGRP